MKHLYIVICFFSNISHSFFRRTIRPSFFLDVMIKNSVNTIKEEAEKPDSSSGVVIVGGGVGGLVCGSLLSKHCTVTILEKHDRCGGRMQSENVICNQFNYRFDIGPSLLLLPDIYRKTFSQLGYNIDDFISLLEVSPLYRIFFADNSSYDITKNQTQMTSIFESIEIGSGNLYQRYMYNANNFLKFGLPTVIEETPSFKSLLPFLVSCLDDFPLLSHNYMLKKYFRSKKLQALLSFQDLYIGLSPYEAKSIFSLLQAIEISNGIYYPSGGFSQVAKSLENIAIRNNVSIKYNSTFLNFSNNGTDVNTYYKNSKNESKKISSKKLITNIDVPEFENKYVHALDKELIDQRAASGRPSCGVLSLSLAFNITLSELAHHNIFFSERFENSWEVVEGLEKKHFFINYYFY